MPLSYSMSACQEGPIKTMLHCSLCSPEKNLMKNTCNHCGQNIFKTCLIVFPIKLVLSNKSQVGKRGKKWATFFID